MKRIRQKTYKNAADTKGLVLSYLGEVTVKISLAHKKAFLLLATLTMIGACGEGCLYDCDVPAVPDSCASLTQTEINRFDAMVITYMEEDEFAKALEIMDCYRTTNTELFTDQVKLRWLTAKFENFGFDTIFGLVSVLTEIGDLISSGTTNITSLPGVPSTTGRTQTAYFTLVTELYTVYNSITVSTLDSAQSSSYNSLGSILSVFLLSSYSYPDTDAPVVAGLYTAIATPVSSTNESFIYENLVCRFADDPSACPTASDPDIDVIALTLANQFF